MRRLVFTLLLLGGCATTTSNAGGNAAADLAPREYPGADRATVYAKAQESLKALDWKIKGGNADSGVILCNTPVVMRFGHTGGEDVMINVNAEPAAVKVTLRAQSNAGAGLGFDDDNLRAFNAELDKRMGVAAKPADAPAAK